MCIACEMAYWMEMEAAQAAVVSKRKGRKAKSPNAAAFICDLPAAAAKKPAKRASPKPRQRATRVRVSAGRD